MSHDWLILLWLIPLHIDVRRTPMSVQCLILKCWQDSLLQCPVHEMKMMTRLSLECWQDLLETNADKTVLRMLTGPSWECWQDLSVHWWLGIFYSWPGEVRPILAGVGWSGEMTWEPDISGPVHFIETSCPVRSLCIEVSVSFLTRSSFWANS